MTVKEQVNVVDPQSDGETEIPALPGAPTDAGISAVLVLVTEKCRVSVPVIVKGKAEDVLEELASMDTSVREVMVGAANVPSAPIASMRP